MCSMSDRALRLGGSWTGIIVVPLPTFEPQVRMHRQKLTFLGMYISFVLLIYIMFLPMPLLIA